LITYPRFRQMVLCYGGVCKGRSLVAGIRSSNRLARSLKDNIAGLGIVTVGI
jgi:hypothetical protein